MNSEPTYAELVQHYSIPGQQPPPEEILRELYAREVAEWERMPPQYSANSVQGKMGLVYDPNAPRNLAAGNYEGEGKPLWEDVYGDEVDQYRAASPVPPGKGGIEYDPNAPRNRAAGNYEGEGKPLWEDVYGYDVNQNRNANYVPGTGMQVYDPNAPVSNRASRPYEGSGLPSYEDYISQEKTFTDSDVDTEEPYTLTQEPYTPTTTPYTPTTTLTTTPYTPTTVPDDDDTEDDEVPSLPVSDTPSVRNPPRKPYSDPDPFYITYRVPIIILVVLLIIGIILYFYYKNKRSTNLNKPIKQVLASFGKMFNF